MPHYEQDVRPQEGKLKLVELMNTVQGEGQFIGVPSVFARFGMCNLECSGCDTKWDSWSEETIESIAKRIAAFKSKQLVITGGEPTLWQDQLQLLVDMLPGHTVTVETNGAVPIRNNILLEAVDLWSFSPKVGSLGHDEKFSHTTVLVNIHKTTGHHQIKYVLDPNISEHADSVFAFQKRVDALQTYTPDAAIFFQPLDRDTRVNISNAVKGVEPTQYAKDLVALTQLVFERSGCRFRVLPQLHKILIWR